MLRDRGVGLPALEQQHPVEIVRHQREWVEFEPTAPLGQGLLCPPEDHQRLGQPAVCLGERRVEFERAPQCALGAMQIVFAMQAEIAEGGVRFGDRAVQHERPVSGGQALGRGLAHRDVAVERNHCIGECQSGVRAGIARISRDRLTKHLQRAAQTRLAPQMKVM